jgi:tRNA(fMet)-specific endonuclease VapC
MRIALDTNRYSDLMRGDRELADLLDAADEVLLPFPALAELRAGFAVGRKGAENELFLRRFLARPGISTLFADDGTTRHYATIYRQLRSRGTPIPTNDLWIGALVLQHDLVLVARDAHFDYLPQIPRA